jgi:hypothetical protein
MNGVTIAEKIPDLENFGYKHYYHEAELEITYEEKPDIQSFIPGGNHLLIKGMSFPGICAPDALQCTTVWAIYIYSSVFYFIRVLQRTDLSYQKKVFIKIWWPDLFVKCLTLCKKRQSEVGVHTIHWAY